MSNDSEQEYDGQSGKRRSRRSSSERSARMEEEIAKIAKDDTLMARELMLMKKEISRMHYKIKSYNSQNRVINLIISTVIIALLVVIAFRLYDTEIPHIKVK